MERFWHDPVNHSVLSGFILVDVCNLVVLFLRCKKLPCLNLVRGNYDIYSVMVPSVCSEHSMCHPFCLGKPFKIHSFSILECRACARIKHKKCIREYLDQPDEFLKCGQCGKLDCCYEGRLESYSLGDWTMGWMAVCHPCVLKKKRGGELRKDDTKRRRLKL